LGKVATKIFELLSVRGMRCIGEVFLWSKKDKVYSRKWQGVHIPQKERKKEIYT
jgi:hypothetical protein